MVGVTHGAVGAAVGEYARPTRSVLDHAGGNVVCSPAAGWDEGGLARPRALLSTLGGEGALCTPLLGMGSPLDSPLEGPLSFI